MAPPKEKSHLETKVDQELTDILESLGPEVTTIKVARMDGGKQQALATYTPSELAGNPEEVIGGDYGPGRYLVRVMLPTLPGKPGNRWGPSKMIDLAEDSQYVQTYLRKHATDPEPLNQGDPWFRMMELQFKTAEARNSELQRAIAEQNKQFHELILAMIAGNKNSGGDIASLIAGVKDLKALSDDGTRGNSKIEELKDLIEMASLIGGSGKEDPWTTTAKLVTAALMKREPPASVNVTAPNKLISAAPAASIETQRPASMETAMPDPEKKPPEAAAIVKSDEPSSSASSTSKKLLDRLNGKAKHERDPELWADWTVEQADDEQDQEATDLLTSISTSASFAHWWTSFPAGNANLRSWWEAFYNRTRETLAENDPSKAKAVGETK